MVESLWQTRVASRVFRALRRALVEVTALPAKRVSSRGEKRDKANVAFPGKCAFLSRVTIGQNVARFPYLAAPQPIAFSLDPLDSVSRFYCQFFVESPSHDQVATNSYGGNIDFYWAAMPNFTVRQAVIGPSRSHAALFRIGSRIRSKSAFGSKILRCKHVGQFGWFHVLLKMVREFVRHLLWFGQPAAGRLLVFRSACRLVLSRELIAVNGFGGKAKKS